MPANAARAKPDDVFKQDRAVVGVVRIALCGDRNDRPVHGIHGDDAVRDVCAVRTEGNDVALLQCLLLFFVQNAHKNERALGKAVSLVAVHRPCRDCHGGNAEHVRRDIRSMLL